MQGSKNIMSRGQKVLVIEVVGGNVGGPKVIALEDEDDDYMSDKDFDEEGLGQSMFSLSILAEYPQMTLEELEAKVNAQREAVEAEEAGGAQG